MKLFKVLSLVLAFVMLFSVLPMAVFAEGEINARDYVSHYPSESEPFVELYEEFAEFYIYYALFHVKNCRTHIIVVV